MYRGKNFTFARTILLLIFIFTLSLFAQTGPQPGDVYKEFGRVNTGNDWRVTDPNATAPGADDFLPNPILNLTVADLQGAVRAELVIDLWGGRPGTTGKKFRFNGNSWITIPELTTTPNAGYAYMNQWNPVVNVPLTNLIQGVNTLEGTSGGQAVYNFGWGQWGWYGVILRVYYNPATKSHPTGSIISHTSGSSFSDNPTVTASASSSAGINRVEFLSYYEGYDLDGDGVYSEWQGYYHRGYSDTQMEIDGNIGTDVSAPYSVVWNTEWVPDQAANFVKLQARIKDNNGVWYVTNAVENLTLARNNFSVKLYKGLNVPERFWVPWGAVGSPYRNKSSYFSIPTSTNLSSISEVRYFTRTWGNDRGTAPYLALVNNNGINNHGLDHFYKFDNFSINKSFIKTGTNTVTYQSNTTHHGSEVLWPGPAVMLKFGSVQNFPPSISQQPASKTVLVGQTASFSVIATGTSPLSYQWKVNGGNISGANSASYTTPPTTLTDNGKKYSVAVTNPYGSITSLEATLSVIENNGSNLALNGNFELGSASSWDTGNSIGGAVYSFGVNATSPISGNYQGLMNVTSSGTSNSRPILADNLSLNLAVGQAYTISFDTKVVSGSPKIGYINYGGGVVPFPASSLTGTQNWSFNLTSATQSITAIYIYVNGTSSGAFAIDNMVVTAGTSSGTPPVIVNQPQAAAVNLGQVANFSVTVTGSTPLSYQWKKNNVNISGANSSSYTTPPTTLADNGSNFSVVVSNAYGSKTSSNATLTVNSGTGGTNISQNGDFEAGSTTSWVAGNQFGGAVYTFALNGSSPISGSFDGKVTIQSAGSATSRPMISNALTEATIIGQPYTISFTTKVLSGTPKIGYLYYGAGIVPFPASALSGTQTWTFNVPSATSVTSYLSLYVNGTSVGSFSVDNVVFLKGGGSGLALNGNFEAGNLSAWQDANNFGGAVYTFGLNSSAPISGTYDGRINITGAGSANGRPMFANALSQTLILGQPYTVSFKTKVISGTPKIGYINYGNGVQPFPAASLSGTQTWNFNVTSATSATGYFYIYLDGRSVGSFSVDDVVVTASAVASAASVTTLTNPSDEYAIYLSDGQQFSLSEIQLSKYFGSEITIIQDERKSVDENSLSAKEDGIVLNSENQIESNGFKVFSYKKNEIDVSDHSVVTNVLSADQQLKNHFEETQLIVSSDEPKSVEVGTHLSALGFINSKVHVDILDKVDNSIVNVTYSDGKITFIANEVKEKTTIELPVIFYDGLGKLLKEDFTIQVQSSSLNGNEIPNEFVLQQNYPNPFNPSTKIKFGLPADSEVNLTIYNLLGEVVNVIANETKGAGYYEYTWNASNFAAGVYIYRFSATSQETGENFVRTKKLMLLK